MDNIPSYINRKHGLERIDYIHPKLEVLLKETYGIIIYQEQVMQIAQILAGYTLGEADLLRRAMGKKDKKEMDKQSAIFVEGCMRNGINKARSLEIFALIEKFASYGFNKSHAAAYAVISFHTAYLKAHYTPEFLTASMNLEINDTTKIRMFCGEAKRMGVEILLPDINASTEYFSVIGDNISYGLGAIKNVGIKAMSEIVNLRISKPFFDIRDFISRCKNLVNKRSIENLIKSGSFDSIYQNRGELYGNIENILKATTDSNKNSSQGSLFDFEEETVNHMNYISIIDWDRRKKLQYEFEALGLYLSSHPLEEYKEQLEKIGVTESNNIEKIATKKGCKTKIAGIITAKKVRSSKRGKYAFLQVSDRMGTIDLSLFNDKLLQQHSALLVEGGLIICDVEIKKDDTGIRVLAESIRELHDYIARNINSYNIFISNKDSIQLVASKLTKEGMPVNLYVELSQASIRFSGDQSFFIDNKGIEELKAIAGVKVIAI